MDAYYVSRDNPKMIFHGAHIAADSRAHFKRVVVIDPDEIPAAKGALAPTWLRNLAHDLRDDQRSVSTSLENVLLHLAEAIDETNALDEPTGLGAVVECADGAVWVRTDMESRNRWVRAGFGDRGVWGDFNAMTVFSEGVQP